MKFIFIISVAFFMTNFYSQPNINSCKLVLSTIDNQEILYQNLIEINQLIFNDVTCGNLILSYESIFINKKGVVSIRTKGNFFNKILVNNIQNRNVSKIIFIVKIIEPNGNIYTDSFVLKII